MPDLIGHLFVIAGPTPVMPDLIGHLLVISTERSEWRNLQNNVYIW